MLDCIKINPKSEASATVIWLHGLGADGHDFEPIVPELDLPDTLSIRYVFPHAPERSITINAGMVMRAWFDILDHNFSPYSINLENFFESVGYLKELIADELKTGMPADRIVLAGFSQGGAIALHTGLMYEKRLAGILALSTVLHSNETLPTEQSSVNQDIPIMMAHGTWDPVVPIKNAIRTKQQLTRIGYVVNWHEYPMEHTVCIEEIKHLRSWLIDNLTL